MIYSFSFLKMDISNNLGKRLNLTLDSNFIQCTEKCEYYIDNEKIII